MSVYGLWYGGNGNYNPDLGDHHVEWWPTLKDAKLSLLNRYNDSVDGIRQASDNWQADYVAFPCVGEDSCIDLYRSTDRKPKHESNPYGVDPDLRLVLKVNKRGHAYATRVENY